MKDNPITSNNDKNENDKKEKKKKGYTKEDIKEKVKKIMNGKNTSNSSKMGNRYKGKKNIGMKTDLKHI